MRVGGVLAVLSRGLEMRRREIHISFVLGGSLFESRLFLQDSCHFLFSGRSFLHEKML